MNILGVAQTVSNFFGNISGSGTRQRSPERVQVTRSSSPVRSFFGNIFASTTRQRSPERVQVAPITIRRPVFRPQTVRIAVVMPQNPLDFMESFELLLASPCDPDNGLGGFLRALLAAAGAPDDGNGLDPEDLKLIISILISAGCLTASGPLLIAFETAGFVWTGYNLAVKIDKMATRISNGEDVLEFNRKNLIEWLDKYNG